ncbi:MAG: Arylsulfatase [Planctomycetota bacterium]
MLARHSLQLPPLIALTHHFRDKLNLLLWLTGLFCLSGTSSAEAQTQPTQPTIHPNFVVIMVDDLGVQDLGCYGGRYIETPHLDRLAEQGVRATSAYSAAAICSPTRAAWITGRYPARLGITDWIRARFQRPTDTSPDVARGSYEDNPQKPFRTPVNPFYLPLSEVTVGEIMQAAGYHTAHIGKWHLGDDPWYPEHQGYEINIGGCDYGQPPTYFDPFQLPKSKNKILQQGIPGIDSRKPNEFLTDREVDEAIALMQRWKDEPFYIQLNHYAVHTPIEAPAELTKKYSREGKTAQQAKYAALVQTVDDGVGKLRKAISEMNFGRPTVFVFTSDNGGLDQNGSPTDNAPLRDGKGSPYEGGLRVPLIFQADGLFPQGTTIDVPTSSIDWLPTLCDLTQSPLPSQVTIDGISLAPALHGNQTSIKERNLIWHFPHYRGATQPYSVLRQGEWKFILNYGGQDELYNLKTDPYETTNLAVTNKTKSMELRDELLRQLKQMDAQLPQPR